MPVRGIAILVKSITVGNFCFLKMTIRLIVAKGSKINLNELSFDALRQCMLCFNLLLEKQYICHGLEVLTCLNMNLTEGIL